MTEPQNLPAQLKHYLPRELALLQKHARALVQGLLDHRRVPLVIAGGPVPVRYEIGTAVFRELYLLARTDEVVALLLDLAAQELTASEQAPWRVSLADPVFCSSVVENTIAVMLHPTGVDPECMDKVPHDARIFRLAKHGDHLVSEVVAATQASIAQARGQV